MQLHAPLRFVSALAVLTALLTHAPSAFADSDTQSLPKEIEDALKAQAAAFSPTITVTWIEITEPALTAKQYKEDTGLKHADAKKTYREIEHVRLTWQSDGKYLLWYRDGFQANGQGDVIPRFNIHHSFDGKIFYQHTANPDELHMLEKTDFDYHATTEDYYDMGYFADIGFELPSSSDQLQHHVPVKSSILRMLDSGKAHLASTSSAQIDSINTVKLVIDHDPATDDDGNDLSGTHTFYLDPVRNYCLVRYEHLLPDQTSAFDVQCSDFQQCTERNIYLPKLVVTHEPLDDNSKDPSKGMTTTFHVADINFHPMPAEKFVLTDTTPGTWFIERFNGKSVRRILQKDGTLKRAK